MAIELKTGTVSFPLPSSDGGSLISEAKMLGYPTVVKGKPVLVELLTRDGRSTTARFTDVTPVDDAARVLLAGRPVEKNA